MTKGELIKALEPFMDETDIVVNHHIIGHGLREAIMSVDYEIAKNGVGSVSLRTYLVEEVKPPAEAADTVRFVEVGK